MLSFDKREARVDFNGNICSEKGAKHEKKRQTKVLSWNEVG